MSSLVWSGPSPGAHSHRWTVDNARSVGCCGRLDRQTIPGQTNFLNVPCLMCIFASLQLEPTVRGLITHLFEDLEMEHGRTFASHAFGCLTVAYRGLSDAEMEDILSCDEEVRFGFEDPVACRRLAWRMLQTKRALPSLPFFRCSMMFLNGGCRLSVACLRCSGRGCELDWASFSSSEVSRWAVRWCAWRGLWTCTAGGDIYFSLQLLRDGHIPRSGLASSPVH